MTQSLKQKPLKQSYLKEIFIQWVWEKQLIHKNLATEDAQKLKIISPGRLNVDDGPDFKDAIIKFIPLKFKSPLPDLPGGSQDFYFYGDIEIHISSTDWKLHNHTRDPKYNNVILHIVAQNNGGDCITSKGRKIPVIDISKWSIKPLPELFKDYKKAFAENKSFTCPYKKDISPTKLMRLIELQGLKRFELRKHKFQQLIEFYGIEQAMYSGIMESLGYVRNEKAFIKLAGLVTIEKLKQLTFNEPNSNHINIIRTALLGTAGLLTNNLQPLWDKMKDKFPETMSFYEWQLFKVRPQGFPANRINGISPFLTKTLNKGIYNSLSGCGMNINKMAKQLQTNSSLIGKTCAKTIVLNVCLPLMANVTPEITRNYKVFKALPENYITNHMRQILWRERKHCACEIYNQGLIHIYYNFCNPKTCDTCPIKLEHKTADTKLCN